MPSLQSRRRTLLAPFLSIGLGAFLGMRFSCQALCAPCNLMHATRESNAVTRPAMDWCATEPYYHQSACGTCGIIGPSLVYFFKQKLFHDQFHCKLINSVAADGVQAP